MIEYMNIERVQNGWVIKLKQRGLLEVRYVCEGHATLPATIREILDTLEKKK